LLSVYTALTATTLHAQFMSRSGMDDNMQGASQDSASKKQFHTNDSISISYFTLVDTVHRSIDSSILTLHENPFLSILDMDLGNTGSPFQKLIANPTLQAANRLGIDAYAAAMFRNDSMRYYQTTKPYTDLSFRMGSKQEQALSFIHTQNINPRWNLAVTYQKLGSAGMFKLQRTNNDQVAISSHYQSLNLQYESYLSLAYNKFQHDENGGIVSEDYLSDPRFANRRLIPVEIDLLSGQRNRSTLTNALRDVDVRYRQTYYWGSKDSTLNLDSTERIYQFHPHIGLTQETWVKSSKWTYQDATPDSMYYLPVGNLSFGGNDSVTVKSRLVQAGTSFAFCGTLHALQAEAGYGIESEQFSVSHVLVNSLNNFVFARVEKAAGVKHTWFYRGQFRFYFTGNPIGNTQLTVKAGKHFGPDGNTLLAGLDQSVQNASYLESKYQTDIYQLGRSVKKESITRAYLQYHHTKARFSITLKHQLVGNYIYRDTDLITRQYAPIIPISQIEYNQQCKLHHFWLEQQLWLQWLPEKSPIHLPFFLGRIKGYYASSILRTKLNIATGIEMAYHSPYYTDEYSPLVYSFVNQYTRKIETLPRVSYFFNWCVKSFRGTLAFDQLQHLVFPNNINYPGYPAQKFMTRFGFHWTFVN